MLHLSRNSVVAIVACTLGALVMPAAAQMNVVSTSPARHALAYRNTAISVTFDRPVDPKTITNNSFWAFGHASGTRQGNYSFSNGNQTVTLTPAFPFFYGESVMVMLSTSIRGADAVALRTGGYSWNFQTRVIPGTGTFTEIQTLTTNVMPSDFTRIYGGAATDFNGDRWVDICTVNEVSADLRVFLNRADGTGMFNNFLSPPRPIGVEASPNESSDFNRDGRADLCAAASTSNVMSIVLGNGDGTFAPQQAVSVPNQPHGITVLDVEGDGDIDIATTNLVGNNVSISLNNGSGVFSAATNFDAGCNGEYALGAGDMNNDGIMDLVVGCRSAQVIYILRGNGNGTFTFLNQRAAGGSVWMLVLADVNGDGNLDVTTANSASDNGSIMLGNGAGELGVATTYGMPGGVTATDVGDIDGDGDMDWVLSAFGGQIWRLFRNNGAGVFTFVRDWAAVSNPACAGMFDIDNDGDIDIVLYDEIDDTARIQRNGNPCFADVNGVGGITSQDIFDFLAFFFSNNPRADFNFDGVITSQDIFDFLAAFFRGC